MKVINNESGNVAIIVVGLIVGLVIGFTIGRVMNDNKKTTAMSSTTGITASAEALNNNLVTLGIDHMTLTDQAIDATLDGNKDATAFDTALYANGNTIGAAVGSVYGSSAQTTFDSVWKLHLDQFVNYAVADSKNDAAGKTAALNAIQTGYTVPLAQYLAKANPNISESALQTELTDHVTMTAQMIDDHVQGNYTAEASELNMANSHITTLFSGLANAIVKQYPSKFAN
jgi:uncharacterized membrane-anchored protein YhcB (DUF1043 family)